MKIRYFIIIAIVMGLFACEKENGTLNGDSELLKSGKTSNSDNLSSYKPEELIQMYNLGMHEFTQALAKTLNNKKIRESIKDEALLKNDGDFDIIWKGFKDKDIEGESLLKKVARNVSKQISEKDKLQKIEAFSRLFKQLQISVPILIDKWNANDQIPVVAFREATKDGVSDFLFTYDKDGNQGRIEKGVIPDYPIVVVNLNERSDEEGNILTEYNKNFQGLLKSARANLLLAPQMLMSASGDTPFGLTGAYLNNYIMLSWEFEYSGTDIPSIQIERENGSGFQLIDEVYANLGVDTYFDYNIQQGNNYHYRIRAKYFNDATFTTTYSSYTPSITVSTGATGIPSTPSNFTNIAEDPNEIQLFWNYPTTNNISGFKLSKRIKGSGLDYDTPTLIPASNRSFLDLGMKQAGVKYDYKLTAYNSISESPEVFCVTWNPYRTHNDYLYIRQIEFINLNDSGFEPWDDGEPEVLITISQKTSLSGAPEMLPNKELLTMTRTSIVLPRSPDHSYNNCIYAYDFDVFGGAWEPAFYKGVVNFNFVEHDTAPWYVGWKSISMAVKIPVKTAVGDITIEASGAITNNVKNWEKNMGDAHVTYWDPIDNHVVQVNDALRVTFSNQH